MVLRRNDTPHVTDGQRTQNLGVLVKTSLVDYPGRVAAALFTAGCNLRCPYCYNGPLVTGALANSTDDLTVDAVLQHLEKRRAVLSGFVISGGEPLLCPELPRLIRGARSLGYKIKLDTNGTLSQKLQDLLDTPDLRPDFVALDVKTSPVRYPELAAPPSAVNELTQSIKLVSALPTGEREFRTVLVPGLVTPADIAALGSLLPKDAAWRFAPFRNKECLDPRYNELAPYSAAEMADLVSLAQEYIPDARLR
jgi:pyruvate formate lyase activating enzyme